MLTYLSAPAYQRVQCGVVEVRPNSGTQQAESRNDVPQLGVRGLCARDRLAKHIKQIAYVLEIATLFVADGLSLRDRDLREELRAKLFNLGRKAIIECRPSKVVHLDCDIDRRRIERGSCAVRRERHLPKAPPQGLKVGLEGADRIVISGEIQGARTARVDLYGSSGKCAGLGYAKSGFGFGEIFHVAAERLEVHPPAAHACLKCGLEARDESFWGGFRRHGLRCVRGGGLRMKLAEKALRGIARVGQWPTLFRTFIVLPPLRASFLRLKCSSRGKATSFNPCSKANLPWASHSNAESHVHLVRVIVLTSTRPNPSHST